MVYLQADDFDARPRCSRLADEARTEKLFSRDPLSCGHPVAPRTIARSGNTGVPGREPPTHLRKFMNMQKKTPRRGVNMIKCTDHSPSATHYRTHSSGCGRHVAPWRVGPYGRARARRMRHRCGLSGSRLSGRWPDGERHEAPERVALQRLTPCSTSSGPSPAGMTLSDPSVSRTTAAAWSRRATPAERSAESTSAGVTRSRRSASSR